jgi:hypothetical protein
VTPDEQDLLALSVTGGDGPTIACYGAFVGGVGITIAIAMLVVHPALSAPAGLVMAGGVIGGLALGAIAYLVVERVYTNARLAALRAIHGIDIAAIEVMLAQRYRGTATLMVRATALPALAAVDHATVAAVLGEAGVPVTTTADGDSIVIETGKLATSQSTGGIGRYTQFNNYEVFRALRTIAAALPPARLEVEISALPDSG